MSWDMEHIGDMMDDDCDIDGNLLPHLADNPKPKYTTEDLWNADPNCDHDVIEAPGGGIKCTKCSGWFCY